MNIKIKIKIKINTINTINKKRMELEAEGFAR